MREDDEDPGEEQDGDPLVADADADEEETPDAQPSVYFRLLNGDEVAGLLVLDELIEAMRDALRAFSSGDVQQPVRSVLTAGARDWFGVMPALASVPAVMGAKLISVFGRNAAVGLPTHLGVVALFSPHTGALVALLDGRTITEARTAAVSALSAGVLARDDAETLAMIGTGAQARAHLLALERQFQLKTVRVWSPTPDHQLAFVTEMQAHADAKLVGVDSAELAVDGADLIVLATSATEPVIRSGWVRSGAHVVSIGACRPDQREIDPALIGRSRLFVDSKAAALVESGDIVLGIREGAFAASHIAGELGDVVAGRIAGRRAAGEVTLFKSLGLAVEDVVAAHLVYQRAIEQNVGLELRL